MTTPAAPTQTPTGASPWTDAYVQAIGGSVNAMEDNWIAADFARRLEALVHQQHEALVSDDSVKLAARAAYAEMEKELSNGR